MFDVRDSMLDPVTMDSKKREHLKELLLKFSYQKRTIRLASGKMSDFYFDGKQTSLHPEGMHLISEGMFEILQNQFPEIQAVGGPTLGADPIATALSFFSHQRGWDLPAFIVRKEPKGHGTMNWLEGTAHLRLGMRVVLVEDVITTGGSLIKAIQHVREAGLVPRGVLVIVDRQEGGRENLEALGLQVASLFTKEELLG